MSNREAERLEAARWFFDIHDAEDPSPELLQDWMRWMEASESHRRAFVAIEATWRQIPASSLQQMKSAAIPRPEGDPYDGSISVQAWLSRNRQPTSGAELSARRPIAVWRRSAHWLALAASAVLIALGLRYGLTLRSGAAPEAFATDTGQQMQITLPDGSQVTLGARSRLTVAYTPRSRNLRLEYGEAFFAVHKDHAWPFRVHVLNDVVTAVGTQFDVRAIRDRIDVSVADGIVQVNADTPVPPPLNLTNGVRQTETFGPARLLLADIRRGESFSFVSRRGDDALTSPVVTRIDPRKAAQWREGWLIYRDAPLRDVLADVARYSHRRIDVADPAAITQRFTGAVYKDSIPEWLRSLPDGFPVSVTERSSYFVVASRDALSRP
jgi:transmembrane sensor